MSEVPNQFHFIFGLKPQVEPFHLIHYLCLESCRRVNAPDAIHFHYHNEPHGPWWERIRPHLQLNRVEPSEFVATHPAYWLHQEGRFIKRAELDYAHHADFLRLQILIEHGGIYADMDTLFVNPLPGALFTHDFVMGSEGEQSGRDKGAPYESLCNAFILSQPQARFARLWLQEMHDLFNGTWDRHSCYAASMLSRREPEAIHILPRRYFFHYRSSPEDVQMLFEKLDDSIPELFNIHLWEHLWWEPWRTDFSTVHKGLFSEHYIRNVDTTFNVIARHFLD